MAQRGSSPSPGGVLYSFRRCPFAMRARMALAAGGINPEIREVALKAKPPAMLALGCRTVPVLQRPDGSVISESIDIMRWVLGRVPSAMAFDPRPELSDLIDAVDGPFKRALDRYKYPDRFPDEDTTGARDDAVRVLRQLDGQLRPGPFLDGDEPGFHDAAVFPFVRQFAGVDPVWFDALANAEPPTPRLVAWRARMANHPWFRRIMKKLVPWKQGDRPTTFASTLID